FAPDTLPAGTPTTLTITLSNVNAGAATLTTALTDAFPASLVVADPAAASTTCAGGSLSAAPGAGAVTLGAGAQIPGAGACTIRVSVVAAAPGAYTNVIAAGDLQTDLGANAAAANALLTATLVLDDTIFADGFDGPAP
ncbi:MAG TPA: hypothetical protein VGC30_11795, partial [Dokdonella sp.]